MSAEAEQTRVVSSQESSCRGATVQDVIISDISMHSGLHGGMVVSTVVSQREDSRFNSRLVPFCVE